MIQWPLFDVWEIGEEIVVCSGEFTEWARVVARRIERVSSGSVLDAPEELFRQVASSGKETAPLITAHVPYSFPITGLVLACRHLARSTVLQFLVTNQNPMAFHTAMVSQVIGDVPGYWASVELEKLWEKCYAPDYWQERDRKGKAGSRL